MKINKNHEGYSLNIYFDNLEDINILLNKIKQNLSYEIKEIIDVEIEKG